MVICSLILNKYPDYLQCIFSQYVLVPLLRSNCIISAQDQCKIKLLYSCMTNLRLVFVGPSFLLANL